MAANRYDIIAIGSGSGGATLAQRAAAAGKGILVNLADALPVSDHPIARFHG